MEFEENNFFENIFNKEIENEYYEEEEENNDDDENEYENINSEYLIKIANQNKDTLFSSYNLIKNKDISNLQVEYLKNIFQYPNKQEYNVEIKTFPRKNDRTFVIKSDEKFTKDDIIKSFHIDLDNILNHFITDEESIISNLKITFSESDDKNQKERKPRIKKLFVILDSNIIEARNSIFPPFPLYPLFLSTERENDINTIFPYIANKKYNGFIDVIFSTGNLYFFLNFPHNIINIPNIPTYCFYRTLQRDEGKYINSFINSVHQPLTEIEFEKIKKELNDLLNEYKKTFNDNKLERQIACRYYFLSKAANKETLKYRRENVISKYNPYVPTIFPDKYLEDFYYQCILAKTNIIYTTNEFNELLKQYNKENHVILVNLVKKIYDYYTRFGIDENGIFNLFKDSFACIIIILPNDFYNRELYKNYIKNYEEYKNDKKTYVNDKSSISKRQLIVCNKFKYFNFL